VRDFVRLNALAGRRLRGLGNDSTAGTLNLTDLPDLLRTSVNAFKVSPILFFFALGGDVRRNLFSILAVCACLVGPANAATITWSVALLMNDSGTGSGSFTIDTSTLQVSSFDITTTSGTSPVWTATINYIPSTTNVGSNSVHVTFSIPTTASQLDLILQSGSLAVAAPLITVQALESNQDLIQGGVDLRSGVGTISAPICAAPLPGALPLFVTGLGALGLLAWWRKRKNARKKIRNSYGQFIAEIEMALWSHRQSEISKKPSEQT
jgi:hypothetical protein